MHPSLFYRSPSLIALHFILAIPSTLHVLRYKNDERAAISWIGVILLSPIFGSLIYWMFGINRVQRQAQRAKPEEKQAHPQPKASNPLPHLPPNLQSLMQMGEAIHHAPYLPGNLVEPLINGDAAYPVMLAAIDAAQYSVLFSSYIFDHDAAGREFITALARAKERGVEVRVLLDGYLVGLQWRRTDLALRRHHIPTARYLPYRPRFANLRNHRKILSIDGAVAFVGGMNIRASNLLKSNPKRPVQDLHFKVIGPVIDQINAVFADDWRYAKRSALKVPAWQGSNNGPVTARILPDGPDENYQKLEWMLIGALNSARHSIKITTPYLLPDQIVICALQAASMRGVAVDIILPRKSNIWFFDQAMRANFHQYLKFGIKLHQMPAPFDHSKMLLIDDAWSFIGSANWDERSLALNFEINLECYDVELNKKLTKIFANKKARAVPITQDDEKKLLAPFIDNFFRLFSPYF